MQLDIERYSERVPRLGQHIIFWLIYVIFFALLHGSFNEKYGTEFAVQFVLLPIKMAAAYLTIYYLMPRYLLKGYYASFFLLLAMLLIFAGFLHWGTGLYLIGPIFYPEENWNGPLFYPAKILKYATYVYPVVVIAALIKFFKHWYQQQKATQQLAQDKLQAELKFLKAQIHPHFLFNTLNNLYALTLKKSSNSPEVVLKLSELLNYMLYECNVPLVPLRKEIDLIKNYISLERLRYGKRLDISLNIGGDIHGKMIAPLLLLPFVENSFKHGVSGLISKAWVSMDIQVKGNQLVMKVDNSKSNGKGEDLDYKEGIGLTNVKRRLELLYEGRYDLKILDTDDSYLVVLRLTLSGEYPHKLEQDEIEMLNSG